MPAAMGSTLRSVGHEFSVRDCIARLNGDAGFRADGQSNSFIHDSLAKATVKGFDLSGKLTVLDGDAIGNGHSGILHNEDDSRGAATRLIVVDGGSAAGNRLRGRRHRLVGGWPDPG